MVSAIYASKIYKSSKRKDKIEAAWRDPSNQGLVTQLASYLDEEYATPENLGLAEDASASLEAEESAALDPGLEDDFNPTDHFAHAPSGGGSFGGLPPKPDLEAREGEEGDVSDILDEGIGSDDDASDDNVVDEGSGESIDEIAEATRIVATAEIKSDVLKSTLNNREDTKGVARIQTKENELWLYYNDDINLNNIMTQVIEYLNGAGYTTLEFNRLARSDNAIVFQINAESQPIQPVAASDEEEK